MDKDALPLLTGITLFMTKLTRLALFIVGLPRQPSHGQGCASPC